ncbi:hypothetical protein BSL78_23302 [Apostichopus japonicus]|uniref:Uncharacterized protein n=1 Tax=Stichopus japonicus TaxID=307972 RepID=A0A2G8JVW2_STIJA|nr:hypothetical protein BSL78_23302 [Apostichopus japonicus]
MLEAFKEYREFLNETEEHQSHTIVNPPNLPASEGNGEVVLKIPPTAHLPCPEDYRKRSIITAILCLPAGLVALRWSMKVHERHKDNNRAGAIRASGEAKAWSFVGVVLAFVFWTIVIIVVVIEIVLNI